MNFLHTEIGSAKDNMKSPIHNWYKFTAGFSFKFVDEILKYESLINNERNVVFEPFAGCGTTLVSCQKNKVIAVGNEGQEFMYNIIKGKINWDIDKKEYANKIDYLSNYIKDKEITFNLEEIAHPLLLSLYEPQILRILYLIKDGIATFEEKYFNFFNLALSQTLHKVAIYPIAVPYISRNKKLHNNEDPWSKFVNTSMKMFTDIEELREYPRTAQIYLHDSRKENILIPDFSCDVCITSPPYLNNLDYGEVSKVHTHFFDITKSWNDITNKVRQNLVTGATTHYKENEFNLEEYLTGEFASNNQTIVESLVLKASEIKAISKTRAGKKSFDILMFYYFQDMYMVLKEIRRVLKSGRRAYLILGDSAPYGIFIPTTEILGKISLSLGFNKFEIHKIRTRGTKWKTLQNRHSLELSENVLIIQ